MKNPAMPVARQAGETIGKPTYNITNSPIVTTAARATQSEPPASPAQRTAPRPGLPPHRPASHTIDGQIAAVWRAYGAGRITCAEAARRDTALRRRRRGAP